MQYVPVAEAVQKLGFRQSDAKYELVFYATQLPPLGYKSYYIKKTNDGPIKPVPDPDNMSSLVSIGNDVGLIS